MGGLWTTVSKEPRLSAQYPMEELNAATTTGLASPVEASDETADPEPTP